MSSQLIVRFLVLQSLMLWQGGFVFYALVVIPVGGGITDETTQGFITQRVTWWLNLIGVMTLLLCLADAIIIPHSRRVRILFIILSALILLLLFILHEILGGFLDANLQVVHERKHFYRWHAYYLILSTVQWLLMLAVVFTMLRAWQAADAAIQQGPSPIETP